VEKTCENSKIPLDSVVFFRTDSAANMAGSKSGAGAQLSRLYGIHHLNCQAHSIMLASTHFMNSSEGKEAENGFLYLFVFLFDMISQLLYFLENSMP
jgi:hypothetical protein